MKQVTWFPIFLLLLSPFVAAAHEVPDDVRIHAFLKPSGNRLQILVRVPINALIDTLFPMVPGPGFLDITPAENQLPAAARLWVSDLLAIYESDQRLPKPEVIETRLSRESDPSFATYKDALAHINGPKLPPTALLMWDRATLDVLLETPIRSDRSDFSFLPRFGRLGVRVTTTLGFLPPDGGIRLFEYEGDPEIYRLDPAWDQSAAHFIQLGFQHIWDETDHLIFLFCLVLLFRRFRALLPFLAVFTAAHSVTLIGSGLHIIAEAPWQPPLAGTAMALSIVYAALECIVSTKKPRAPWLFAAASGIAFGSGFWFFVRPVLQFGGAHNIVSVLSYNAGIEMGQGLALAIVVPAVYLFFRFAVAERIGSIIFSGLAAHMAWHRMTERAYMLSRVPIRWPTAFNIGIISPVYLLATIFLAGGLIWFVSRKFAVRNALAVRDVS